VFQHLWGFFLFSKNIIAFYTKKKQLNFKIALKLLYVVLVIISSIDNLNIVK